MNDLLFVYGTLRRGQPLHRYLPPGATRFVGEGTIAGRLFDLGEYPGAIADVKRFSRIKGEIYEIVDPAGRWSILDEIEGYDAKRPEKSLFERRETSALLEDGRELTVWAYYFRRPLTGAIEIPDGDFLRYRSE